MHWSALVSPVALPTVPSSQGVGAGEALEPVDRPQDVDANDSLSPVAPWRIVNIGNSQPVQLGDMIAAIEEALGIKAERNLMPMQPGDVPATWADAELLQSLTGYVPRTDIREGVSRFITWYRDYYRT